MSYFLSPEFARVLVLGGIVSAQSRWAKLVNETVPKPYLDEVFHVPQAQAYWQGNWTQWDPKITTPPALYIYSHIFTSIRGFLDPTVQQSTADLRFSNTFLLYLLLVALYIWSAVSRSNVQPKDILHREFNIVLFPLLFFFSGVYYTDLFSVLTVIVTYLFWLISVQPNSNKLSWQMLMFGSGLISLASRQTNIFWVAVFLGGLQVVESVKSRVGEKRVHDPEISNAYFEDFPITSISIAHPALSMIPQLLLDLWPQISLLICFGLFILWNDGSVVLGDKSNHIATIHLPQLLYLFPMITFFSWPIILLPHLPHLSNLKSKLPRASFAIPTTILILLIIHYNTIIHPFTLADNRHYTFYVFRLLIFKHWVIKYAVAPIYFVCAWLVLIVAWGGGAATTNKFTTVNGVRISFALIWFLSTALSLVTAPLVEPRYFIIPWLIWRLHVPGHTVNSDAGQGGETTGLRTAAFGISKFLARHCLWVELAWYMLINYVTCWLFLYRGFEWKQELGNVQRFMW